MLDLLPEDTAALLADVSPGEYLLEHRGRWLLLWRLTEGEPPDGALEPALDWVLGGDAVLAA
jgi:hypothetical protein